MSLTRPEPIRIVPIVEGHGEEQCVPQIIRRALVELLGEPLTSMTATSARNAKGFGSLDTRLESLIRSSVGDQADLILVVVDADEEGAITRSLRLRNRIATAHAPVPVAVVAVNQAIESWLYLGHVDYTAVAEPVCRDGGLDLFELEPVVRVVAALEREVIGRTYAKRKDPAALAASLDLHLLLRQSRSFRRLIHALDELRAAYTAGQTIYTPIPRKDSPDL